MADELRHEAFAQALEELSTQYPPTSADPASLHNLRARSFRLQAGFPRSRGDSPPTKGELAALFTVLPHTRG